MSQSTELTVQGQSLQNLYTQYFRDTFIVNRRYQRKLVWGVDEKERLIDSVAKNLPIPLILLAEYGDSGKSQFEIIDGLQRLNAIFSFLENEYSFGGRYFDLETLADTKYQRDAGQLRQKAPVLDRETCLAIVNYQLPVSTYRSATEESVDEVFRRINSSGRKLSLQEIRQAGVTSDLAHLVRRLSAAIRGDATLTDLLPLREMPKISITSRDLEYGIPAEEIFWVRNGILERDAVRESRDEELVLDLLLDITLDPVPVTGSAYRNSAYGRDSNATTSEGVVASRLNILGVDEVEHRFLYTLDLMKRLIGSSGETWASWVITQQNPRSIPRYFQAVFVSIYELLFLENLEVENFDGLNSELHHFWDRDITIPGGGGNWGANRKRPLFDSVKAHFRPFFASRNDPLAKRIRETATEFEVQLQMAITERNLFELKQGFLRLEQGGSFDDDAFEKMLRTASAMANSGPDACGHIFIGVADVEKDAMRVAEVHGVEPLEVGNFFVTGTRHEITRIGRSADQHLRWVVERIKNSKLDSRFATELAGSVNVFEYKGYLIWSLEPRGGSEPVSWNDSFFAREGNSTLEVRGAQLTSLMRRFV